MQEEISVQKYKNKEKNKCYEKKDMFLKVFGNSKWSSFSGGNKKYIPQARSNDKKRLYCLWNGEFWKCGA